MPVSEPPRKGLNQQDIALARQSAKTVRRKGGRRKEALSLQINGSKVPSGSYLNQVVQTCLEFIADGRSVAVMAADDEIGTQEAADLLKVSRPYFVKLLDAKAIPSRKVGVQRRVRIEDVLAYKEKEKTARRKVLQELAAEGQRLKLGE
jgi:excisionase family DNA binding protein